MRKRWKITDRPLREGFPGVRDTVKTIAALAIAGSWSRNVRRLSRVVRRSSAATIIRDLDRIARTALTYRLDPADIELVQGTDVLLDRGLGDCDDYTVFLSALGLALDLPTRITVVRRRGRSSFHHVFPEFEIDNRWIPLDSTTNTLSPGEYPKEIAESRSFVIPPWGSRHASNSR